MALGRLFPINPAGINQDLTPDKVDVDTYNSGSNVIFRDGIAARVKGYGQVFGAPLFATEALQYMLNTRTELTNYWLYCTGDSIGVYDGSSHHDISPVVMTPIALYNQWTGGNLNGVPVLNTKKNNPVYWDLNTSNAMLDLPGWPAGTKAEAIRPFKYHLIAMNITDAGGIFGEALLWSSAAEPGTIPQSWTPLPSNEAGSNQLSDTPGVIVDGLAMANQFIIYKNSSTYALQYVGGNQVFRFRKVLKTSGMLAKNCGVEIKGMQVILTDSDVVLFDGNEAVSLLDARNKKWLFNQIDPTHFGNSYVVANTVESEIWVCFPSNGSETPDLALVWSKDSNDWGVRELDNISYVAAGLVSDNVDLPIYDGNTDTYATVAGAYDQSSFVVTSDSLVMASPGEHKFFAVDTENTNDGVNVVASIKKTGLDLKSPGRVKLLKRVWPKIEGIDGTVIKFRLGCHDSPNSPIAWGDQLEFEIGADSKVDGFTQGKYLAVEITSDTVQPWRMSGMELEYTFAGAF